ncbi:hypothetical protein AMIS_54260 [Actinoplanes missouriensis 431]|uniref:Uncharacterized protein n=1 Tax=Actinoplanes missouriensis (strain ATCC 14538 / DSM 43046 / CBS 188.64 / JCM 3121 / NBRC 102363 / NCIMB 12654 / NRRL B-3342 / UNCC 431) TaxID=512565 RepID=I0HCA9_ACTM4|nr:hypothetical protein [Actinoplanes missouriensis]BAL90646.1 hypothetical protein AMIS_54260 [Actinoplanes missouriensis 431]
MDDTELHRERILRHVSPIITGRFVGFQASYTREVRVGRALAIAVFVTAGIAQMIGSLMRMRPARRSLKDLRKGPEFLVTPVRLRDDLGQTYEIEMHGQLPQSALHRGDLVQVRTQPQADPTLPVKLMQVVNLTTMQPLTPRIPTRWSHLGPAMLLQAAAGLTIFGVVLAALLR